MHEKESPFLSLNGLESARKWIESFHRAKESIYILMVTNQFLLKESLVTEDLIFGLKFYHSKWWGPTKKQNLCRIAVGSLLHDHVKYFYRLGFPKKAKVCTMGFMVWNKIEFEFEFDLIFHKLCWTKKAKPQSHHYSSFSGHFKAIIDCSQLFNPHELFCRCDTYTFTVHYDVAFIFA